MNMLKDLSYITILKPCFRMASNADCGRSMCMISDQETVQKSHYCVKSQCGRYHDHNRMFHSEPAKKVYSFFFVSHIMRQRREPGKVMKVQLKKRNIEAF